MTVRLSLSNALEAFFRKRRGEFTINCHQPSSHGLECVRKTYPMVSALGLASHPTFHSGSQTCVLELGGPQAFFQRLLLQQIIPGEIPGTNTISLSYFIKSSSLARTYADSRSLSVMVQSFANEANKTLFLS